MNKYSIKDLEQYSGIKAHTIRIWEKRYELLQPSRTDTNIRFYDDKQLVKLLNVSTLLNQGWKISKLSLLKPEELNREIERLANTVNPEKQTFEPFINGFVIAMSELNEMKFEKVFSSCVLRFGLVDTMMKVVYPFLEKVGLMWSINKIKPAHEHFATNIIRQKLLAAIDGLLTPEINKPKFLLYLFQKESHEIGLLFANFILRSLGHRVLYLGQNLPEKNLIATQEIWNTENFLSFFVMNHPISTIQKHIDWMSSTFPNANTLISLHAPLIKDLNFPKNVHPLTKLEDLTDML